MKNYAYYLMALFIMLNFILPKCSGDCEDGYGTYTWSDGDVYEGDWKDDKIGRAAWLAWV